MSLKGHVSPSSKASHPVGRVLFCSLDRLTRPAAKREGAGFGNSLCLTLPGYKHTKQGKWGRPTCLVFLSRNEVCLSARTSCLHRSLLSAPILWFLEDMVFPLWLSCWIRRRPHSRSRSVNFGRSWSHDQDAELFRSLQGSLCLLSLYGSVRAPEDLPLIFLGVQCAGHGFPTLDLTTQPWLRFRPREASPSISPSGWRGFSLRDWGTSLPCFLAPTLYDDTSVPSICSSVCNMSFIFLQLSLSLSLYPWFLVVWIQCVYICAGFYFSYLSSLRLSEILQSVI